MDWQPSFIVALLTDCKQPTEKFMSNEMKCPFSSSALKPPLAGTRTNADWWPNQLSLNILQQHSERSNPMGKAFSYAD